MMDSIFLLAAEVAAEEGGGLFDLDATLPLMAVQFLILAVVLNALFYKPLGKAIDERDEYVRSTYADAQARLSKAEQLAKQYEKELAETRRQAQTIITDAQAEAQSIVAQKVADAQKEAQVKREQVQRELDEQRQSAMASLEQQVESLSQEILDKLLKVSP